NNGDDDTIQAGFLEKFKSHVILESSGLCIWMIPTTFKSSCEMDITNFPFDSQECEMTFGSWTYDNRLLQMEQVHETHVKTEKFVVNGDWNIRDITIKKQQIKYICCKHPFSDITYTFILDRKPNYHVMYLIVPCVIISLLSLLSFVLPPDCGERVGLSITTLLAMSVYLLIMSEIIPETSDFVPRLGVYYITVMVLVAASLAATTITLRCHYNRNKPPKFLKKLFGCKKRHRRVSSSVVMEDLTSCDANNVNSDVIKSQEKEKSRTEDLEKLREEWRESWIDIAAGLDKFFFAGFVITFVVTSLGILLSRG
ncbi:neuronal acetylcholine receptor subunit alpha-3-like, partial [Exaiptasia diaphana]|uniref:Uncharacterized protein n=1 Tax=Exaiptasia diaphana TaxID=2652724 RepID=A0A913YH12_EXADI